MKHNFHAIEGPNGMCACGVKADGTVVTCGALLEEYVQERIVAALENPDDEDSYLWARCYNCGHRLAMASDSCPQCGIHFKDGEDPANWPEECDCERCVEARRTEPE